MHPRGGTADLRWLRFLVGPHSGPLLLTAPVPPALGRTRMLGQECRRRVVGRAGFGDLAGEGASGRQAPSVVAMIQSPPARAVPGPCRPPRPARPGAFPVPRPARVPATPARPALLGVTFPQGERREGGGKGAVGVGQREPARGAKRRRRGRRTSRSVTQVGRTGKRGQGGLRRRVL
jgi:hypothetical protein